MYTRFRNTFPAFGFDAHLSVYSSENQMNFLWEKGGYLAKLKLDFEKCGFQMEGRRENGEEIFSMEELGEC